MRVPAFAILIAVSLSSLAFGTAVAADPTAEHRRVYAEINDTLGRMTKQSFELDFPGAPVASEVTVWLDGGQPRKIEVIYPDDHGVSGEAYYLKPSGGGAQLMFVYQGVTTQTVNGSNSTLREQRYYFNDGRMFRWLDEGKTQVPQNSEEFKSREGELLDTLAAVLDHVSGSGSGGGSAAGPIEETAGTFLGLEQGDYTYLRLRVGGDEQQFMILQTDDALERLLNSPRSFVGKKIVVTWQSAMEDIPEAGGRIEVTKALSVKLSK